MAEIDDDILDCMRHLKNEYQPFALATVLRTEDATSVKAGAKVVVRDDGSLVGWLGSGCAATAVRKAAKQALADGKPRIIRVRPLDRADEDAQFPEMEAHNNNCASGGTLELFIEPVLPRPELVIFGASPVARALSVLAGPLGFDVAIAAEPADRAGFPADSRFITGFALTDHPLRRDAQIIIATQGKRDREALRAALASSAEHVAMIASRRKAEVLRKRMLEDGVTPEALARLTAPAGLDIGAVTPAEIALSILAGIVRERNGWPRAAAGHEDAAAARSAAPSAPRP